MKAVDPPDDNPHGYSGPHRTHGPVATAAHIEPLIGSLACAQFHVGAVMMRAAIGKLLIDRAAAMADPEAALAVIAAAHAALDAPVPAYAPISKGTGR
jgi:hypothetical protein